MDPIFAQWVPKVQVDVTDGKSDPQSSSTTGGYLGARLRREEARLYFRLARWHTDLPVGQGNTLDIRPQHESGPA